MIATHIFDFKKQAVFYVVSTHSAISDLVAYGDLQSERKSLQIERFIRRLKFHDAYCHIRPTSLFGRLLVRPFIKGLKQSGHYISFDGFAEAYCIANPEAAVKNAAFSLDNMISIVDQSPWTQTFDVDRDEVVRRMRISASS